MGWQQKLHRIEAQGHAIYKKLVHTNLPDDDIARKYQSELLAGLTLILCFLQIISIPLYITNIFPSDTLLLYFFMNFLFAIILLANRYNHYRLAAYLLIASIFITMHSTLFGISGLDTVAFVIYSIVVFLISGIFLSLRSTIYVITVSVAIQLLVTIFDPQTTVISRTDVFIYVTFTVPILLIFIYHRNHVESASHKQMSNALTELRNSETHWRSLASNSPDLIIEIDLDYKINFINRVANEAERNQVVGRSITDFIYPEYHAAMFAGFEKSVEDQLISEFDGRNLNLAGEEIWFSARVSPIIRNNETAGFIISSRDVTEHRAAERALSYFQGRQVEFQVYLTLLHDIRAQLAACANITEVYKQAVKLGKDVLLFDRIALFIIDEKKQLVCGTYGTDAHGNVREESDYTSPVDNDVWPEVLLAEESVVFWRDVDLTDYKETVGRGWKALAGLWDGKKIIGFVVTDNLLTHYVARPYEEELIAIYASILAQTILHKRGETQRINLAVQTEKIQLLEDLISDLSHDIRTPLTSIHNYLYLLKKQTDVTKSEKHLNALERQINHLTRLVEDILAMARLDKNEGFLFEEVGLNSLLETVIQNYKHMATQRGIEISVVYENSSLTLLANNTELARALSNLLENAINYTPDGGQITIHASEQDHELVIKIADTGIGISAEDLTLIFDRFYRADKARNTIKGGTGLGLAIVKRVIELHNGRLEVESTLGQGSTFTIWLPLKNSIVPSST